MTENLDDRVRLNFPSAMFFVLVFALVVLGFSAFNDYLDSLVTYVVSGEIIEKNIDTSGTEESRVTIIDREGSQLVLMFDTTTIEGNYINLSGGESFHDRGPALDELILIGNTIEIETLVEAGLIRDVYRLLNSKSTK